MTHLHLVLNHVPVMGLLFGFTMLLYAAVRHNATLVRAALVLFVVAGIFAVPTYLTGEPAEETVERIAGVSEAAIERHEDAARIAVVSVGLLAVLAGAFLGLSRKRDDVPRAFVATMLFLSLVTGLVMGWTASLGGEIRHTEISGAAATAPQADD